MTQQDEVWMSKDGRKTPVGEMSSEHLRNTIRMFIRRQRELKTVDDLSLFDDGEHDACSDRDDGINPMTGLSAAYGNLSD